MDGTIIVTAEYSIILNVGKQAGDGSTFFDVEYDFNRLLSSVIIDAEKSQSLLRLLAMQNLITMI